MVAKEDDPASCWVSVTFQGGTAVKLREGNLPELIKKGQTSPHLLLQNRPLVLTSSDSPRIGWPKMVGDYYLLIVSVSW